ncbi:MAG: hypothetical protein HOE45_11000 [Gammaproteobacteria bacterium]|jgi:hypothetical protein|nr:hypothetical protein [Gammaproteobacteria bacterium]MBT4147376.1 hypothetical protein [Gammaproteobacteria bacterium]MBT5223228.1 hypothetical protein [Gammaproteobacteria bacterium]MBT5824756.1 hypothetical protein [Gammaproteobacteria bacterium]MBT5967565.1 hypothetical protein [Gammaproteobacteria bacterium]
MFGFNKKKDTTTRSLTKPVELKVGDIVVLNERQSLPKILRSQELEVTGIGTHQYSDGIEKEVTFRSIDNKTYYMSIDDNDGDPLLCFSIKIERADVEALFDLEQFAGLFDDSSYTQLDVQFIPDWIKDWIGGNQYQQTCSDGEGYYFKDDLIAKGITPSSAEDDSSEAFRFQECESNDDYGLLVEVWSSGETDVFLSVSTPLDVVAEMWPHGKN